MFVHIYDEKKENINKDSNRDNHIWIEYKTYLPSMVNTSTDILVKENINSDDFLRMILKNHNPEKKYLSHLFILKKNDKQFIVSDGALNQFPTLEEKVKIAKNALDFVKDNNLLARDKPLITFLNHSGHFNIKNKTTCDTTLLVKWCTEQFGNTAQFSDYQLDCCFSQQARDLKQINIQKNSDIVIPNDINEGNSIIKSFLLNDWNGYGFLTGANIKVVMNSRANLYNNNEAMKILS